MFRLGQWRWLVQKKGEAKGAHLKNLIQVIRPCGVSFDVTVWETEKCWWESQWQIWLYKPLRIWQEDPLGWPPQQTAQYPMPRNCINRCWGMDSVCWHLQSCYQLESRKRPKTVFNESIAVDFFVPQLRWQKGGVRRKSNNIIYAYHCNMHPQVFWAPQISHNFHRARSWKEQRHCLWDYFNGSLKTWKRIVKVHK